MSSAFVPLTSDLGIDTVEPRLVRTKSGYEYVTTFGNYTFLSAAPYVMNYSIPGVSNMVSWSAFLIGAGTPALAIPMVPANATIAFADNYTMVATYTPTWLGVPQGEARLRATFSAYVKPTFEVNFTQANTSNIAFNILWLIAGTPPYLQKDDGSSVNLDSLTATTWLASANQTAALTYATNPLAWPWTLRVDWSDAGAGDLYGGPIAPFGLNLGQGIIVMFPSDQGNIDPSVVASVSGYATVPSSERETFYYAGYYWAFFYDSTGIHARTSPDGLAWTIASDPATGAIDTTSFFDVDQRGATVALAWVNSGQTTLFVETGTLLKGSVSWNGRVPVESTIATAFGPVGVAIGTDGNIWVTGVWAGWYWITASTAPSATTFAVVGHFPEPSGSTAGMARPLVEPDGSVFLLLSDFNHTYAWYDRWNGTWTAASPARVNASIPTGGQAYEEVSAVVLPNGTVAATYPIGTGMMLMSILPNGLFTNTGGPSSLSGNLANYPTLGEDAFGSLYLYWVDQGVSSWGVDYAIRAGGTWTSTQVLSRGPSGTTPNYLNAALEALDSGFMIYSQQSTGGVYKVEFVGMPLPTNLGASPSQPSARDGLSPYGSYFHEQSDYVGTGNGLLTVVQTDADLPGRGMNLRISRVFSTPRLFLNSSGTPTPYLYDTWAWSVGSSSPSPLGLGWGFDFPQVGLPRGSPYLRLFDGQEYVIRWNANGLFENHVGAHFVLSQYQCRRPLICYTLVMGDGTTYHFDDGSGDLTTIADPTGQNNITFVYNGPNGLLSAITDTIGRTVTLGYSSAGQIQNVSWAGRTVHYVYDSMGPLAHLVKVVDALGRTTVFAYTSANPWLLTSVAYPAGGRSTYAYRAGVIGEASSSLVTLENLYNGTALVKSTSFSYDLVNGRVSYAKVTISNGSAVQGSTANNFNSPMGGMTSTVYDAAGHQLRKSTTWYTLNGTPTQTDAYVGNVTSITASSFEALDDWGNVIYTRDSIGRETFASYANTDRANVFYAPGLLSTVSSGQIFSANFDTHTLAGWTLSGQSAGWIGLNLSADPLSAPSLAVWTNVSSSTIAAALHSFPSQTSAFVAEARIETDPSARTVYFILQSSAGISRVQFAFDGGQMEWYNGASWVTVGSYVPGAWYLVGFDVNMTRGKYDIWVNGARRYANASLTGSGDISQLRLQAGYISAPTPIHAGGDDFRVYAQGNLTLKGLPWGAEVEAVNATDGNVAGAAVFTSGQSTFTLNTLALDSRSYYLRIYNATQALRDGNMEAPAGWTFATNASGSTGGFSSAAAHTGLLSYRIAFTSSFSHGNYAEIKQDVAGFSPGDTIRLWFEVAPTSGSGGCGGPNPGYVRVSLSTSPYQSDANPVDIASSAVYVTNLNTISDPWAQIIGEASGSSFRLHARIVALNDLTSCALAFYLDDIDAGPESTSSTTNFWGGDVDFYTPPAWRTGEFYSIVVPSTMHDRLMGTLSWQNGSLDPVLYYDMSTFGTGSRTDLVRDMSGHGNDGTIGTGVSTGATGFAGAAMSFPGTANGNVATTGGLAFPTSAFTLALWVYPTSLPTSNTFLAGQPAGSGDGVYLYQNGGGLTGVLVNAAGSYYHTPTGGLGPGMWTHVAFTFDGSTLRLYLNGIQVGSGNAFAGTPRTTYGAFEVGGYDGFTGITGTLDEVRVYNRALVAGDILQLATLRASYDMETFASPSVLSDAGGYQNPATLTNGQTVRGQVGKAQVFNGTTRAVAASSTSINIAGSLTLAAWVNISSLPATETNLVEKNNYQQYRMGLTASGLLHSTIQVTNGVSYNFMDLNSPSALSLHRWHFVAFVFDASNGIAYDYVDGVQVASRTTTDNGNPLSQYHTILTSAQALYLGFATNTGQYFIGILDEVHVFGRALSSADLAALNLPKSTPPSRTFLTYNSVGESTEQKTYHNGTWLYTAQTFDVYGNMILATDPNGVNTSYAYSQTYNSAYLTSVSRGSVSESYVYDFPTGLLTSRTDPRGYSTTSTYDLLGRTLSTTQPAVGGATPITNYAYDDTNGIATTYDPDSLPRLLHFDMDTLFSGRMEDLSGHGGMGTLHGVTSVAGPVGHARFFNGNGYINVTNSSSITPGTMSATAWFNVSSGYTGASMMLLSKWNCVNPGIGYYIWYSGTSLQWNVGTAGPSNTYTATYPFRAVASTWYGVAATYDGLTLRLYLNGVDVANATSSGKPIAASPSDLDIGMHSTCNTIPWHGSIDEVQLFSGALSGATIGQIFGGTEGGRYVKTYYDGLGREVRAVQRSFFSGPSMSTDHEETYAPNWLGQVAESTNANGSHYQTAYDFLGRLTSTTNPDGSSRTTSYDDINRTITMTDEVGHNTQDLYDLAGRLVGVRQYTTGSSFVATTNVYDLAGELVGVTDPLGQTTSHVYDDAGRLVQTVYPDATNESYVYDNVGNLIAKTDRGGRTLKYAYDSLYRLKTVTYSSGSVLRYSYDADGEVTSVQNDAATLWFTYDALDRMTSRSLVLPGDTTNYTTSYGYDAAGNLLTLAYPDGQGTLTYGLDAFYRVVSLAFGGTTVASFAYRKDNLLSSVSYGDGSVATYVFNSRGFPLEIKVSAGSTSLLDLAYAENATGQVTGITNKAATGDTEAYAYDPLDRITSAVGPWGTLTYAYDAAGNRLSMRLGSTTTYYKYGGYDKLCESSTSSSNTCSTLPSASVTRYYYDANGNVVDRVTSANASYTFDVDNRLVNAVTSAGTYTFAYDGLGDRVRETGPSGSKTFNNTVVASGDAMLYLKDVVGSTTTKTVYLYAGSLLVASLAGTTYSYFHEDALGDTRLVTQASHGSVAVVFATNYEPFGVQYAASGADPSVKYTGQWDEALGLYWNHARFYDPTLGRFVSADPVLGHLSSPQTLDRYAYAVDDPERFADPSGGDCSWNPLSWGDCVAAAGNFVYQNTVGAAVSSYNWYTHASAADQRAFWIGIGAAILVGVGVAASCVFLACVGLMMVAAGGLAAVGGSLAAVTGYHLAGGQSVGGIQAEVFWGGIAGGAAFSATGSLADAFEASAQRGAEAAADGGGVETGLGPESSAADQIPFKSPNEAEVFGDYLQPTSRVVLHEPLGPEGPDFLVGEGPYRGFVEVSGGAGGDELGQLGRLALLRSVTGQPGSFFVQHASDEFLAEAARLGIAVYGY